MMNSGTGAGVALTVQMIELCVKKPNPFTIKADPALYQKVDPRFSHMTPCNQGAEKAERSYILTTRHWFIQETCECRF